MGIQGIITDQMTRASECADAGNDGYGRSQGDTWAEPKQKAKPSLQRHREACHIAFGFLPTCDPDPLPLGDRPECAAEGADTVVDAALVASPAPLPDVHVGGLVGTPDPRHLRRSACTQ